MEDDKEALKSFVDYIQFYILFTFLILSFFTDVRNYFFLYGTYASLIFFDKANTVFLYL